MRLGVIPRTVVVGSRRQNRGLNSPHSVRAVGSLTVTDQTCLQSRRRATGQSWISELDHLRGLRNTICKRVHDCVFRNISVFAEERCFDLTEFDGRNCHFLNGRNLKCSNSGTEVVDDLEENVSDRFTNLKPINYWQSLDLIFQSSDSRTSQVCQNHCTKYSKKSSLCKLNHRNRLQFCRRLHASTAMAKSKFEYVKQFEVEDRCLPNCWIVVRIDGKSFHRFSDTHHFVKPNDERALGLMSRAAQVVMEDFKDVAFAYGQSDEYSFVFKKHTTMYNRRGSKIMTNLVSLFSSAFVMNWPRYFATQDLQYPPAFDARVVLYPSDQNLKDYLSWRQADCHINNLYNTVFWKLVQERCLTPAQSQERLKGTLSSDKNEILFTEFNINYNNLPELYRKGTVLIRNKESGSSSPTSRVPTLNSFNHSMSKTSAVKYKPQMTVLHCDIIGQKFWDDHPEILDSKKG